MVLRRQKRRVGKLILAIEDDLDLRTNLKIFLEDEGYTVILAKHGQAALDYLSGIVILPSLILLDLMMPVMDGWTFREKQDANVRLQDIPVIVFTASGNLGRPLSVKAIIKKPVNLELLLQGIEKHSA
jgi:CheY-like chemotaxis protein